jgi:5-methylcytosine-specific restriction endonuclease McrA
MPQFFKRDVQATKEARKAGRIHSPSWISLSREVSPSHCGSHEILRGRDMRERRNEVFDRDGNKCVECGATVTFDVWLELDHVISKGRGGCDCQENLQTLCCNFKGTGHHQRKHLERKS